QTCTSSSVVAEPIAAIPLSSVALQQLNCPEHAHHKRAFNFVLSNIREQGASILSLKNENGAALRRGAQTANGAFFTKPAAFAL
ncbi:MAG TPA: hypothetical protein VM784_05305, partial [Actinomycetota bacterium]|nr:hypothetical protein [Actinomycetota bacterium]